MAGARPKQLLFIQGGGKAVHDAWDHKLVASLEQALGPHYALHYPRMPNEAAPDPAAWKEAIAQEIGELSDGLFLVAHSVGAAVLLDFLADAALARRMERRVAGLFLIAAPFIGDGGWPSEGLRPPTEAARALHGGAPLYFYQGRDDQIVPFAHLALFAKAFPSPTIRRLEGRNHQLNDDLTEVARDITRSP